ncbi:DUF3823 domain-containing protein [Sunxiuqinia dokdonensis]|uniref:DUF3823 domain-containing protein n=1 Tax=Sunxiuqinia dokdonensis TaxID=1409788 RepID=A0A0L8VAL7_9BACT|nr:DUF3823 domain-containing protein [Sunxiuqinia dokdonensis]KOH45489.1 hypothetical protein NC99_17040 [Sunxiuqinia dokdonensis]
MTKIKLIILLGVVVGFLTSCEWDNYDAPGSMLQGNIVYNGEAINVSYNDVIFELWEPGWQLDIPIDVTVDQDGSYSALLFNGTYKLIIPSAQGPWRNNVNSTTGSDTVLVNLNGDMNLDIEVEPYYMIRNAQFSASGRDVTATFQAEKIITDAGARDIERVNLYIGKTQFVDFRGPVASAEIGGGDIANPSAISMTATVPSLTPTQNYVYARVGLKIAGIEDMVFSSVQKIDL